MKPISCNERNAEHRKAFVPRSPTGPCSVSRAPSIRERHLIHLTKCLTMETGRKEYRYLSLMFS